MSRPTSTLVHAASVVVLAGCFSADPAGIPTFAPKATAVLITPAQTQECNGMWKFIGDVAIAEGGDGYTTEGQWEGPGCDQNQGGSPGTQTTILQFGSGTEPTGDQVGSSIMQSSGNSHAHVAADGATGAIAWADSEMGTGVIVAVEPTVGATPLTTALTLGGQPPANLDVAGMVMGATAAYVALTAMPMFTADVNNPTFPCCGQSTLGAVAPGYLFSIGFDRGAAVPTQLSQTMSFPAGMPNVLASNTANIFYVVRPEANAVAEFGMLPKMGSDSDRTVLGQLTTDLAPNIVPVGLAADNQHVAWAAAIDQGVAPRTPGCWIFSIDLSQPAGTLAQPLFTSTDFSCMSLAIDATSVYFSIVGVDKSSEAMIGLGIGRVSLADGSFESIAVHMAGDYAGPRRVYLDNVTDSIYAIDPLVIGKLPKADLDGAHDF